MTQSPTLQLLGLQYELALLIGKGIVLEPMLRAFFPQALRRLGCRSAYVWLSDDGGAGQTLRYVYPRHEKGRVDAGGDLAQAMAMLRSARHDSMSAAQHVELPAKAMAVTVADRTLYLHCFALGERGHCLLVRDHEPLDEATCQALLPIMARLADACIACLEHDYANHARYAAAEKERQLRETILENSVVGIAFLNPEGRVVWANQSMGQIFGTDVASQVGVSLERFYLSREAYLSVGGAVAQAVMAGKTFAEEVQMRRADGSCFWVNLSGKAVNPKDLSRGTVWVVMDISRRRELEDQLQRKTSEQEAILQSTQIGITFTTDRIHQWVNRTFANMLGFEPEELIGRSSRQHYPDDESFRRVGEDAYPLIARGEAFADERQFRRKNGEVFPVQMFARAVDPSNPGKGSIWTVIDLTERHRLEAALKRAMREQEVILQTAQVGIVYSRDRHYQWVNKAMADMLGYDADAMVGRPARMQFPSDEVWARFGADAYPVLATGDNYEGECELAHRDGTQIWVQVFGRAIDHTDLSKGAIWTAVDITQRKQAEENARRALEQQQELAELKSRFVSMASHEFRTPLATILSSTELLRYYGDRLPKDEQGEILGSIEGGVRRMTEMLDNILLLGRADAGRLEFAPAALEIEPMCLALVEEVARAYSPDGKGLDRLDFSVQLPAASALLDEKLLRHILGNLLSNAYKYSPGGGRIGFRVWHEAFGAQAQLCFEVKDSGIGIPPADLQRLFESFHRATNVGNIAGTGLGMAIVKRAADLHGGTLDVQSTVGQGSCFTLRLPWQSAGSA